MTRISRSFRMQREIREVVASGSSSAYDWGFNAGGVLGSRGKDAGDPLDDEP